jgi:hypothetical protein
MQTPQIADRLFLPNYIPTDDQKILTVRGKLVGTLCNYVVYSGLPKAGKSTFVSALIASAFSPYEIFGQKIDAPVDRRKVALFDTESAPYDLYKTRERIRILSDKPTQPERLDIFTMREDDPGTIKNFIEQYMKATPECSVIVIDGLLDLCLDYNDPVETRLLTNWMKRITKQYNCLIVCVLHLSKNVGETVGHLGSNTDRWAQSTLTITRNKEQQTLTLEPKFLRSSDDFNLVSIKYMEALGKYIEVESWKPVESWETKKGPGRPKKQK